MNKKSFFVISLFLACGTTFASRWKFKFEELGTVAIAPLTVVEKVGCFDMEVSQHDEEQAGAKATFCGKNSFAKGEYVLVPWDDCSYLWGRIWAPDIDQPNNYMVSLGNKGAYYWRTGTLGKQKAER